MDRRTLALVLFATLAVTASAQDAELRAKSGPIQAIAKAPKAFSGSLGMTTGARRGYEATVGGAIGGDRLFFFASAQQNEAWQLASPAFKPSDEAFRFDGKMTAQLGASNTVTATGNTALPSSFLSLRMDSVVSGNSFFSFSVSQRSSQHDRSLP